MPKTLKVKSKPTETGYSNGDSTRGLAKRKHGLKRQHALLPKLAAEAPEQKRPESAKARIRRKRAAKSAILGAVDGMRSSLDDLLAANERRHQDQQPAAEDDAGAAQLPHLEHLAVDVPRVLGGGEAMAEVVRGLAVGACLDSTVDRVSEELDDLDHVQELDGQIGERDELGLARRHRDARGRSRQ